MLPLCSAASPALGCLPAAAEAGATWDYYDDDDYWRSDDFFSNDDYAVTNDPFYGKGRTMALFGVAGAFALLACIFQIVATCKLQPEVNMSIINVPGVTGNSTTVVSSSSSMMGGGYPMQQQQGGGYPMQGGGYPMSSRAAATPCSSRAAATLCRSRAATPCRSRSLRRMATPVMALWARTRASLSSRRSSPCSSWSRMCGQSGPNRWLESVDASLTDSAS